MEFVAGQIAERQYRLAVYQDVVDRLRMVIDERAAAARALPKDQIVPGGSSGLLARRQKMLGSGLRAALGQRAGISGIQGFLNALGHTLDVHIRTL